MGSCGCGAKSELFNVGDKVVLKETYGHCGCCGQACVTFNLLDKKDLKMFEGDPEEYPRRDLGVWMGDGKDRVCIGLEDLWESVDAFMDDAFEKVIEEDLDDKEYKVFEEFTSKFLDCFKKRMKERSEDQ